MEPSSKKDKKSKAVKVYGIIGIKGESKAEIKYLGTENKKKVKSEIQIGYCDSMIEDVKGHIYSCNHLEDDFIESIMPMIKIYFWKHKNNIQFNLLEIGCYFVPDKDEKIELNR